MFKTVRRREQFGDLLNVIKPLKRLLNTTMYTN